MPKLINLTGQTFGRLTVISEAPRTGKHGYTRNWHCVCKCGETTRSAQANLIQGKSTSCGCISKEQGAAMFYKHGETGTPEHNTWKNMKQRCTDSSSPAWKNYGGRGISVCPQWQNSFQTFLSDMGPKPDRDYSIDRIDNGGNYTPENCRWTDRGTQNRNRRNNVNISFMGETKTRTEWAHQYNIDQRTLGQRLDRGMSMDVAITTPIDLVMSMRRKHANSQNH